RIEPGDAGDEIGEDRLIALAARRCRQIELGDALGVELDRHLVLRDTAAARRLDEDRAADAAQLAAFRRARVPLGEFPPAGFALRPVDQRAEIPALEDGVGVRLV